jgi:hypothetical protein
LLLNDELVAEGRTKPHYQQMTAIRIAQFRQNDRLQVAIVNDKENLQVLAFEGGCYALASRAVEERRSLREFIGSLGRGEQVPYQKIVDDNCLLPPVTHPDPAHCFVTGTGLTHLGSADTRDVMHAKLNDLNQPLTDSMKMFKLGLAGGKPQSGCVGEQPEWFYKGDGSSLVAPYAPIPVPAFALDAGEEPELVGIYLVRSDGVPCRLGFAIGNEFSDHITERQNYLWLAHSKLRNSSFGPELFVGSVPSALQGVSRVWREGKTIWEKPFLTGEENMSHSIANLEHHHFKYVQFRRAGDLHVHFFGTSTLSFADNLKVEQDDEFEIDLPPFGRPQRNLVHFVPPEPLAIVDAT